ncbi:DUF6215 domain-containing protein [Streptomyces geranii]|uniref:DUF6215 domain-containing protein n=1 Tax=Streptomyces geranii TaxID=2058923 RepID=UPI000D03202C|nr:DUF6215 domain-containing protein [Streptomyces geranii]
MTTEDIDAPRPAHVAEKGASEGAQIASALLLVGCLAAGFWVMAKYQPDSAPEDRTPASCSRSDEDTPLSKPVSGVRLCEALNRPDLPTLLGTPEDRALSADSNEAVLSDERDILPSDPEATVQLEGYSVKLSAYGDLTVGEIAGYLAESGERRTFLGHSAFLYSGRTIGIVFEDGKGSSAPGGTSRNLLIAKDPKDGGGSYEISLWRQDDTLPDDTALLRVAESVLPTVPGWTAS